MIGKRKRIRVIKKVVGLWLIWLILCLAIWPAVHKEAASTVAGPSDGISKNAPMERVRSIDTNADALLWRLRLIELARERIVLVTFDFCDDDSGQDIMAALYAAAERGVKVQILVDGINGKLRLEGSAHFQELISHENVEARLYNPISLLTPWKANFRMHDKYLMADDTAYILGGRNTDNRFLGEYKKHYNEDRDILVYETIPGEGTSYCQLEEYFEKIWDLPCSRPCRERRGETGFLTAHYGEVKRACPEAFAKTDWLADTMETQGIVLCTNPMEPEIREPVLWEQLVAEMKKSGDILIQTPYIICSQEMYRDLTKMVEEGARIRVMINAVESGTNPFGCTDYLNQKGKIRKTGVEIYEYLGEQAQHTKTILVGDRISMVGSCNLDMRSIYLDTEMMLVIDCPELNADIRGQIGERMKKSRHMLPDETVRDGENYHPAEQSTKKAVFYGILRVITIPFRHLL